MAEGEGEKKQGGSGGGGGNDGARGEKLQPGPAATTVISLSQILLAPLDALFKAQVHAARSFLNFVLQLSYPHIPHEPEKPNETPEERQAREERQREAEAAAYATKFTYREPDESGKPVLREVEIPTLALVPLKPLSVEEASFKLSMAVSDIGRHRQIRSGERDKATKPPPWYLVDDPISVRGVVAPPEVVGKHTRKEDLKDVPAAKIDIEVKVGVAALPAGLEKLLTRMTQSQVTRPVLPPDTRNDSGGGGVKELPPGPPPGGTPSGGTGA